MLDILSNKPGPDHPNTQIVAKNLAGIEAAQQTLMSLWEFSRWKALQRVRASNAPVNRCDIECLLRFGFRVTIRTLRLSAIRMNLSVATCPMTDSSWLSAVVPRREVASV